MEVYLVQHGEAKAESEDPARPLTPRGQEEVQSIARYAAKLGLEVGRIYHSGKLRAKETAEILARLLSPPGGVEEMEGLAPMDDPARVQKAIEATGEPLMLVGHLPHLSRLASLLLTGSPEREIIRFRMGGILCLTRTEGGWAVRWMLIPEIT